MPRPRTAREALRRPALRRRPRAFGSILLLLATLPLGAGAQTESEVETSTPVTEPEVLAEQGVDPALVERGQQLGELLAGTLPVSIEVPALFGIALDDHSAVKSRVEELALEVEESKSRVAEMQGQLATLREQHQAEAQPTAPLPVAESETPAEPELPAEAVTPAEEESAPAAVNALEFEAEQARLEEFEREERLRAAREAYSSRVADNDQKARAIEAQLASATLRLDVATKRLRYLRKLEKRLGRMTDASRRVLPSLGSKRDALRSHVDLLSDLRASLYALVTRLEMLAQRSEAGMLVGFVSEQRALGADLSSTLR